MMNMARLKILFYGTGTLLAFIGLGAVICGLMLVLEPDGGSVGLPLDLLEHAPFSDYLIPGMVLFAVNGLASLAGAFFSFRKHRYAGFMTMILGLAMIIWISAEVYWVGGESFLQPTMFAVGLIELLAGFLLQKQNPNQNRQKKRFHQTYAHK